MHHAPISNFQWIVYTFSISCQTILIPLSLPLQEVHLVMELCEGGELFDRIKLKGKFSERESASVLRTVAEVLIHCHGMGVMHRDLKPENILLISPTSDTDLKVIDFGVATFFQKGTYVVQVGEIVAMSHGPCRMCMGRMRGSLRL